MAIRRARVTWIGLTPEAFEDSFATPTVGSSQQPSFSWPNYDDPRSSLRILADDFGDWTAVNHAVFFFAMQLAREDGLTGFSRAQNICARRGGSRRHQGECCQTGR